MRLTTLKARVLHGLHIDPKHVEPSITHLKHTHPTHPPEARLDYMWAPPTQRDPELASRVEPAASVEILDLLARAARTQEMRPLPVRGFFLGRVVSVSRFVYVARHRKNIRVARRLPGRCQTGPAVQAVCVAPGCYTPRPLPDAAWTKR